MSDPCQCIFDHEAAMRRLISWLRENGDQTGNDGLPDSSPGMNSNSMIMWTMLWGMIALVMFFARPNSLRSRPRDTAEKPRHDDENNQPPPPDVL
ncbi:unnamed protein product [Auanema sp. JU1783]|nr:unnamed protein product [Auanema sp. JU1783]